ncbi:MAG: hypothetical protein KGL54_13415 [Sphingomonadales bacterium]|nr:hypothetical protein [Sphingomonadales bacterium]
MVATATKTYIPEVGDEVAVDGLYLGEVERVTGSGANALVRVDGRLGAYPVKRLSPAPALADPTPGAVACTGCAGTGRTATILGTPAVCLDCYGAGRFAPVDLGDLRRRLTGRNGFRRSLSSGSAQDIASCRAYYVWRLVRFHGNIDPTMPFVAGLIARNDPFMADLDAAVTVLGREFLGARANDGAIRWGRALGLLG